MPHPFAVFLANGWETANPKVRNHAVRDLDSFFCAGSDWQSACQWGNQTSANTSGKKTSGNNGLKKVNVPNQTSMNLIPPAPLTGSAHEEAATSTHSDYDNLVSWSTKWLFQLSAQNQGPTAKSTVTAYTLDLIPRQSTLNVAEAHSSTGQVGFAGLFGWLSGLGARGRFERQHQEFDQFTQQEAYASGFGKGDYIFGWTFGAQPGTKQLNEGLRTTYAVIVVPITTTALRLEATGCGYRRRVVPDNPFAPANSSETNHAGQHKLGSEDCGAAQTFYLSVSPTDDSVWVDEIRYKPVPAGLRQTVTIDGQLGREVGVLINGTPLQAVPSVTQPLLTPAGYSVPANGGDSGVQGVFENIQGKHLVLSFIMPPTFVGTPTIALVSVGQEKTVNNYTVWPNGEKMPSANDGKDCDKSISKLECPGVAPMFIQNPAITGISATYSTEADKDHPATATLTIIGQGFKKPVKPGDAMLLISGHVLQPANDASNPHTNEYVWQNSSVLTTTIDRNTFFPHWNLVYALPQIAQTFTASFTQDDGGPAVFTNTDTCTYEVNSSAKTLHFVLTGDFFSASNTATVLQNSTDLKPTTTFIKKTEWDMDVAQPSDMTNLVAQVQTANDKTHGPACNPKPAAKKPPAKTPAKAKSSPVAASVPAQK